MRMYSSDIYEHTIIVANKLDILGKYAEADEVDEAFMNLLVAKNVLKFAQIIKKMTEKVEYYINEA